MTSIIIIIIMPIIEVYKTNASHFQGVLVTVYNNPILQWAAREVVSVTIQWSSRPKYETAFLTESQINI